MDTLDTRIAEIEAKLKDLDVVITDQDKVLMEMYRKAGELLIKHRSTVRERRLLANELKRHKKAQKLLQSKEEKKPEPSPALVYRIVKLREFLMTHKDEVVTYDDCSRHLNLGFESGDYGKNGWYSRIAQLSHVVRHLRKEGMNITFISRVGMKYLE